MPPPISATGDCAVERARIHAIVAACAGDDRAALPPLPICKDARCRAEMRGFARPDKSGFALIGDVESEHSRSFICQSCSGRGHASRRSQVAHVRCHEGLPSSGGRAGVGGGPALLRRRSAGRTTAAELGPHSRRSRHQQDDRLRRKAAMESAAAQVVSGPYSDIGPAPDERLVVAGNGRSGFRVSLVEADAPGHPGMCEFDP